MNRPDNFIDLAEHLPALAGDGWQRWLRWSLERLLGIDAVRDIGTRFSRLNPQPDPPFDALCMLCRISLTATGPLTKLPPGPLVVVSNHPFGIADALGLAALATRSRHDVRVLANAELMTFPGLAGWLLPLVIMGEPDAAATNTASLRSALRHLRHGGALVIFPAGAVAHWHAGLARVADPPWSNHAARIIQASGAAVVPVRFTGANPWWFHLLGTAHPLVRSVLLFRAFIARHGSELTCHSTGPIAAEHLPQDPTAMTHTLRQTVAAIDCHPGN
jgi:putative hemolysin